MKLFVVAAAALSVALAAIPDPPKSKIAGSTTAPMRLELYEDFTCPHCRLVHEQFLPQIMRDYVTPGKAYIVFRDYVLTGPGHQFSHDAAAWAAAAARIGKYPAAADALFKSQGAWVQTGAIWPNLVPSFSAEEQKKLQSLFKDPSVAADVKNDIDAGNNVPVTQTPTLVVVYKGKKQPWAMWNSYALLKSYLDTLLTGK